MTSQTSTMTRERWLGRAHIWTATLLLSALVGMVNYLAFRHYKRWDWTKQHLFTLSDRTIKVVKGLHQPVDVYFLLSEGSERNYGDVKELLERYKDAGKQIHVHYVDPDRQRAQFLTLAQRFGLSLAPTEGESFVADVAVVLTSGSRTWKITRDDLVDFSEDTGEGDGAPHVDIKTERALTGALLEVSRGRASHVCVTTGHGEWKLSSSGERSLEGIQTELRRENVEFEEFTTLGAHEVPKQCDAVFVIGPMRAFSEDEAGLLKQYNENSGNILLALDPIVDHDQLQSTGLESLLKDIGIEADNTLVLEFDPAHLLAKTPVPTLFFVTEFGNHRTTNLLAATDARILMHQARSVRPQSGSSAIALLETSKSALAKSNIAEFISGGEAKKETNDIEGPIPLAVAVTQAKGNSKGKALGRAVIVGDSDWLEGSMLNNSALANADLMTSIVGWLTERDALISIAPKKAKAVSMNVSETDLGAVLFRVLGIIPGTVFLLGLLAWWSRRS